MAGIGIHMRQYTNMQRGIELLKSLSDLDLHMEVYFPWAVIFTGKIIYLWDKNALTNKMFTVGSDLGNM